MFPYWAGRLVGSSRVNPAGPLVPFFRFCDRIGVEPHAITGDTVEQYEAWLSAEMLDLRPRHTANAVATSWRRMQRLRVDWPRQELPLTSRKIQKALPLTSFPSSFNADLTAHLASLRTPDPLDRTHGKALSDVSIDHVRRAMLRAATYLVQSGTPGDQIAGLSALVQPAAFRTISLAMHTEGLPRLEAAGETAQWTRFAYDVAAHLVQAARRWVKLAPEALAEITEIKICIKPRLDGLSERVQADLAEFMTDEERAELYGLPWRAFEEAETMLRDGDVRRAAKCHEDALGLAIVLMHHLRLADLARLDPTRHTVRDRRGTVTQFAIRTNKTSVKVRAEIDPELAARIARHIEHFRPHVPGHSSSAALFPSKGGRSRWPSTLGTRMHRLVARQLGKRFTAHLARHLAVDICLDDDPTNLAVAQRLLGHRSPETTKRIYGARATIAANRRFSAAVREQATRAGLSPPGEQPRKGRKPKR